MKIAPSILKLMLVGSGAVGVAAGVHAMTAPATVENSAGQIIEQTTVPASTPVPPRDPCPACGMG